MRLHSEKVSPEAKRQLIELFGDRVHFKRFIRHAYSTDISRLPSEIRLWCSPQTRRR